MPYHPVPPGAAGNLNPLQQIYGGGRRPNLIGAGGGPAAAPKPLALKHLERQQIIVNTYSQPTQLPAYANIPKSQNVATS